jgi:hypothetical protein
MLSSVVDKKNDNINRFGIAAPRIGAGCHQFPIYRFFFRKKRQV